MLENLKAVEMKCLKLFIVIALPVLLARFCYSQDDYQNWLKEQGVEYRHFISEQDSQFISFLKSNWKSVNIKKGLKKFHEPKVSEPVIFDQSRKATKPLEIPIKKVPVEESKEPKTDTYHNEKQSPAVGISLQKSIEPFLSLNSRTNTKKNELENSGGTKLEYFNLNYFGSRLSIINEKALDIPIGSGISADMFAGYWKQLCGKDYHAELSKLLTLKDELNLNDWGYCKLLFDAGNKIDSGNKNESYLFTWFMLIKSGYLVRAGYKNENIYLLISTDNQLFNIPFFHFAGIQERYYVLLLDNSESEPIGVINTYKGNYSNNARKLNFGFESLPKLGGNIYRKVFHIEYANRKYSFPVECNANLIDFYRNYPNTDLYVYFHSQLSPIAKKTLLPEFKSAISTMNDSEAVSFLLHFVQYVTGYETDQKQFGREKPFFPEESLYYPYSDCEDRAVFFSYLVRNLLGLNVIGLAYTNHVATAVNFNKNIRGDYIMFKNKKYVICDPTYLDAPVGKSMPNFKNIRAEIIQ